MGGLSTHVLDTALGIPGQQIRLRLYRVDRDQRDTDKGNGALLVCEHVTNADGRTDTPLMDGTNFAAGTYELIFDVAEYFALRHPDAPQPPFLDRVTLRFTMTEDAHYHVPLLLSPWSYSTYRGS